MSLTDTLKKYTDEYGIDLSDDTFRKLKIYASALAEWNEKVNLTAIKDSDGVAEKHFLDCLMLLKYKSFPDGARVIDVGTGAGFPGLVLAAALPSVSFTLLDSTGKKLKAVEDIASRMGVENVGFLHARAEEAGRLSQYRERFDFATARAVAELRVLLEYAVPFVKKGGQFISMKGSSGEEELTSAEGALRTLNCECRAVERFCLPSGDKRTLFFIEKISQNSIKYPRVSAQIAKKPL